MSTLPSADMAEHTNALGLRSSIIDQDILGTEGVKLLPLIEQIRQGLAFNPSPVQLVAAFKDIINHDGDKRKECLITSKAFEALTTPPASISFNGHDLSFKKFAKLNRPSVLTTNAIAEVTCLDNVSFKICCGQIMPSFPYFFQIIYTDIQGVTQSTLRVSDLSDSQSPLARDALKVIKQLTSYLLDAQLIEATFHEGGIQSLKKTLERINESLPKPPERAIKVEPAPDTDPSAIPIERINPVEGFRPVVGAALVAVREEFKTRGLYDDGQIANAFQLVSDPSFSACWDDIYNKLMAGKILDPTTYIQNLTKMIDQETLIRFKTDLGIPLSGPIPDDKVAQLSEKRRYKDIIVQTATAVLMMHVLNNQHTINTAFLPLTDTRLRISQYLDLVTDARFAQLAQSKLTAPINKDALKVDIFHGLMKSYLGILPQEEMTTEKRAQLKKISGI